MSAQKMHRVLVVDDESDVTELLQYRLEQEGYRVATLNDPLGFVVKVREFEPDLMLLDIMMPELSGIQLCRIVRADPLMKDIPVIFLSARGEVEDRIKGLEAGAEDYVAKPFNTNELLLRISKMLKRSGAPLEHAGQSRIEIAGVVIEEDLHQLAVDGKNVYLTATEFRLLKLLMERKGRVQTRDHLLVNVWHYDKNVETRTVDTHVRRIREKLGQYAHIIETVRGVGYRAVDI
ncbi:MAG: response regulator transcription factor [Verrucomicrobiota bacterium]|nr:response regulator transcription factor [Verrucomicrobiota bacterium]